MKNNVITIKDVAKKAGVSVSTVSKVLNGYDDISEKTRAVILELVDKMKYVPDSIARGLVNNESKRVGVFFVDYNRGDNFDLFNFDIMMGFKQYMSEHGYEVVLMTTTPYKQRSIPLSKVFLTNHLDGIFVFGLKYSDPYFSEIQTDNFPYVIFDFPETGIRGGSVGVNSMKGAMLATEHLLELGHRKVAFVNGHKEAYVSKERLNGYFLALNKYDIPIDKNLIFESDFTEAGAEKAMEELIKRDDGITAVFAASDLMASGVIKYLHNIGKSVPGDISVVGFDDIIIASHMTPRLTTIKQDRYELGALAATLLLNLINGQNINSVLIEPELIIRESTRNISNS